MCTSTVATVAMVIHDQGNVESSAPCLWEKGGSLQVSGMHKLSKIKFHSISLFNFIR